MSFIFAKILMDRFDRDVYAEFSYISNFLSYVMAFGPIGLISFFNSRPKLNYSLHNLVNVALCFTLVPIVVISFNIFALKSSDSLVFLLAYLAIISQFLVFQLRLKNNIFYHQFLAYFIRPFMFVLALAIGIMEPESLIHTWVLVLAIIFGLSLFWYFKALDPFEEKREKLSFNSTNLKVIAVFALISLTQASVSWLDKIVLFERLPSELYAEFTVAFRLSLLVAMPMSVISSAYVVRFKSSITSRELLQLVRDSQKEIRGWLILMTIVVMSFSPFIMSFLGFPLTTDMLVMLALLILVQWANSWYGTSALVLNLFNGQNFVLWIMALTALANYFVLTIFRVDLFLVLGWLIILNFAWNFTLNRRLKSIEI